LVRYASQVSWVLIAAFALSALYELYRSTIKAGTSKYDSMRGFLTQAAPFCAVALALAVLVRTGWQWVAWTALALAVALILVSIFYYSPTLLPQRKPGPIDWLEDKVYTGLLFVGAALLAYDLLGRTLVPS
jgi:phosphatidylserine synthase